MKVAVIGSRSLNIDIATYIPPETTEIVSGGAKGIDTMARKYAIIKGIRLTEFLPDYNRYSGRTAPLVRNKQIIEYADMVVAIWDGHSKGTIHSVELAKRMNKRVKLHTISITQSTIDK